MSEKKPYSPPILRLLQALARSVDQPDGAKGGLARFITVCRWLVWALAIAYTAGLAVWFFWLEYFGDMWWCTWFFLYVPPPLFLFPLAFLVPASLLFDWRALIPCALCILCVVLYEGPEFHGSRSPRPERFSIRVLSNNIGQHGKYRLTPFLEEQGPDLIVLQEAYRRGQGYVEQYGEQGLNAAFKGEFICASKYPIEDAQLLDDLHCENKPVAARFVLDVSGRRVVVYNVHIASPRDLLDKLRGRGFVAQILDDFGVSAGRDYGTAERVAERRAAAKELAERIAKETDPVIVAGDFNTPARGRVYHAFASGLADTFEKRGCGFGFTFPGRTRNPFSLFGPWLRLDIIFAGKDWRVLSHMVEPDRPSQHRAVVSTLELREK